MSNIEDDDPANLPAVTDADIEKSGLPSLMKMSPGLALFFNDAVYMRCKSIAGHMARAEGMMPKHLIGHPEACFAVISRAITWNLDPYSVAMATYQTPGGSIGYMGVLIQSILESSGALNGGVKFSHHGDWSKVQGKFKIETSTKGGKYPVPTWGPEDAAGLYVVVSARLKNEIEARELRFDLNEAFPLNSPLWATAPNRQICYTAVRAFANIATPALLMGVPFDIDPTNFYTGEPIDMGAASVAPPRPRESPFAPKSAPPTDSGDGGGAEVTEASDPRDPAEPPDSDGPAAASGDEGAPNGETEPDSQEPPHAAEDENQTPEEEEEAVETTIQRGERLLAQVTSVRDIGSLRDSIGDSLDDPEEQARWELMCDDRRKAIMSANPAQRRPKGK